jgi:hypothetical protein
MAGRSQGLQPFRAATGLRSPMPAAALFTAALAPPARNSVPAATNHSIETSGSAESRLTKYFNTSAFCPAPVIGGGTGYGDSSDGVVRGPMQDNSDITISRLFSLGSNEKRAVDFRAEFFNAFNHAQFSDPGTGYGNGGFGQIQSTSVAPRIIQFAAKISF